MLDETNVRKHYEQLQKEEQENVVKKVAGLQELLDEQQSLINPLIPFRLKSPQSWQVLQHDEDTRVGSGNYS